MGMLEGTATVATLILSGDSIHVDDTALGSSWSARRKRRGVYVKVFSGGKNVRRARRKINIYIARLSQDSSAMS